MPDASFNSINFSNVTTRTPSISTEASAGIGKRTGFGFPSPGYSPLVITSMVIPSAVERSLLRAPSNAGRYPNPTSFS